MWGEGLPFRCTNWSDPDLSERCDERFHFPEENNE
jgi:hypothetical protein